MRESRICPIIQAWPNLVGVDIGCGMETLVIKADSPASENFDLEKLDKCIRKNIPVGGGVKIQALL